MGWGECWKGEIAERFCTESRVSCVKHFSSLSVVLEGVGKDITLLSMSGASVSSLASENIVAKGVPSVPSALEEISFATEVELLLPCKVEVSASIESVLQSTGFSRRRGDQVIAKGLSCWCQSFANGPINKPRKDCSPWRERGAVAWGAHKGQ